MPGRVEHLAVPASFEARFPPKRTAETDRCHRRAERHRSLLHSTRGWPDRLDSLPAPTRRAGALCGLRPNPGSERFYHRGTGKPVHRLEGSPALGPSSNSFPDHQLAPVICCHGTLRRGNLDFVVPPPGRPERRPDSRCARATPRGDQSTSDDTPAPREAPKRSRLTNRRPVGQRPPAALLVTDSPP
jgi:hypothetical protein